MGLFQKACETYDAMSDLVGVSEVNKDPLTPVGHILTQAHIEITLNKDGQKTHVRRLDKDDPKIIIPVTEQSGGRSGKSPTPHPLCDKVKYLAAGRDNGYVDALQKWCDSPQNHPKLGPILKYVQRGTILQDLVEAGIVEPDGVKNAGDLMVCWVVNGIGEAHSGPCWRDKSLMSAHVEHMNEVRDTGLDTLCMITGEKDARASNNPKGVVPLHGNAKLVSSNDSSGYTYRGRFVEPWQASSIGYTASQKAHAALRWLIGNQAVRAGKRAFVCWNPHGNPVPRPHWPMQCLSSGQGSDPQRVEPSNYREDLRKTIASWNAVLPDNESVVIAAFDAATTGRLAVTYYNELTASDFLARLYDWDATCCWPRGNFGIQSPSLHNLVTWAFGSPLKTASRTEMKVDSKLYGAQMQRMLACRMERASFPGDVERRLVERASNLHLFDAEEDRRSLLHAACAAVRKYHNDRRKKEIWKMSLDRDCTDRSYLFGRLLAIADAVERCTYTDEERRETNAMRMQKAFTQRPMTTWRALQEKLKPYQKRLMQQNPRLYFYWQALVDEIAAKLDQKDAALGRALEDVYLLGFYHQRAYRRKSPAPGEEAIHNETAKQSE